MQLVLEFGHDTDSYLQVAGAFVGAIHGRDVFAEGLRQTVLQRLEADYGDDVTRWMRLLGLTREPDR
jgi:ADP-ribosylglycohydrolase